MNITINENFSVDLYGFAGVASNMNWSHTGMTLMNKMWHEVRSHLLKHKGINIWVYEEKYKMFAGIELEMPPQQDTELELKKIRLPKYAYYKHTGPYAKIRETGSEVLNELNQRGIKTRLPHLEIYGHWTEDESKLETELLWCLA